MIALNEPAIRSICRMEGAASDQPGEALQGIKNAERLLPEARGLLVEFLQDTEEKYQFDLKALRHALEPINKIVLDPELGYSSAVSDEWPGEIHVGPWLCRLSY
jgi:hypothetical protein